jgi:hypothetical protein
MIAWIEHIVHLLQPYPTWLVVLVLSLALSPLAAVAQAGYLAMQAKLTQKAIKGKQILFVIAHPDDEAM